MYLAAFRLHMAENANIASSIGITLEHRHGVFRHDFTA